MPWAAFPGKGKGLSRKTADTEQCICPTWRMPEGWPKKLRMKNGNFLSGHCKPRVLIGNADFIYI